MPDRKSEKEQAADSKDPVSCVVCFKHTEIFSIGECDHVVCYECSARLRVLLKQNDCMICRAELSQVFNTKMSLSCAFLLSNSFRNVTLRSFVGYIYYGNQTVYKVDCS